jgi:hypothetical protein
MLRRICFYPVIGFDSGFTGLLDYDYLALSVGWGFESGFSGFRGFLSVRRWLVF